MTNIIVIDGEKRSHSGNQSEDLNLVLTTNNLIIMEMVKEALENEGIPVLLKSVAGYHSRGMLPFGQQFFDYNLFVSENDKIRAEEIVATIVPPEELQ